MNDLNVSFAQKMNKLSNENLENIEKFDLIKDNFIQLISMQPIGYIVNY